jgi:hypothetical protein
MPQRVQRTRIKGQPGIPAGAKYVGRGTRWGNPYKVVERGRHHTVVNPDGGIIYTTDNPTDARRVAVDWYRAWFSSQPGLAAAARRELAGRDLACWCATPESGDTDHCHARVLLEYTASTERIAL